MTNKTEEAAFRLQGFKASVKKKTTVKNVFRSRLDDKCLL